MKFPILSEFYLFSLLLLLSTFSSCKEKDKPQEEFDRAAMLENYADALIIPRYNALYTATQALSQAVANFNNQTDGSTHILVQEELKNTRLKWQACSSFSFGPALDHGMKPIFNIYPIDTAKIEENINNGSYQLDAAENISAIGLPALEYLLHKNNMVVTAFIDDADRKVYLLELASQLENLAKNVSEEWEQIYGDEFISKSGTDVGSALGMLVNSMNQDYEKYIRDGKLGLPLGVRSLGQIQPHLLEAPYAQYSLELLKQSITAYHALFNGIDANGNNGLGIDDHIAETEENHGNANLAEDINAQFQAIESSLEAIPAPLHFSLTNHKADLQLAYDELQKMVVLTKVDMSSVLGILITYQDNDGD